LVGEAGLEFEVGFVIPRYCLLLYALGYSSLNFLVLFYTLFYTP
jgi:hypothetical protein